MINIKKYLLTIPLLLLIPGFVFAYHALLQESGSSYVVEKWADLPVDFLVDSGGNVDIFEDACDEWNNVDGVPDLCGDIDETSEDVNGGNFNEFIGMDNGINEFIFDDTGGVLAGLGIPAVLGITLNTFVVSTGELVETVIVLNTSRSPSSTFDPLGTTVHELGHSWGLAHTPIGGISTVFSFPIGLDPIAPSGTPTMYPFNIPTNASLSATLEYDDEASINVLYKD